MEDNIKQIIKELKDKTNSKKISWVKTSSENEYKIQLNKGAITTDYWIDEDGNNVAFDIYNEDGNKIVSLFYMQKDKPIEYSIIKELHTIIDKNFYKVDETLNGLLDELKK